MRFKTKINVRYSETDQMKVVYYANYLIWMEQARSEFLEELGLPYHILESQGYFLPVMEAYAKYHHPARYGDKIIVWSNITITGIRVRVDYKIKKDELLLVDGYTIHVFTTANHKPIKPPKIFLEVVGNTI